MKNRAWYATLCYVVLAILAGFTLRDFPNVPLRTAVWVLLAALAAKTWINAARSE